jgi:hypothetical protein
MSYSSRFVSLLWRTAATTMRRRRPDDASGPPAASRCAPRSGLEPGRSREPLRRLPPHDPAMGRAGRTAGREAACEPCEGSAPTRYAVGRAPRRGGGDVSRATGTRGRAATCELPSRGPAAAIECAHGRLDHVRGGRRDEHGPRRRATGLARRVRARTRPRARPRRSGERAIAEENRRAAKSPSRQEMRGHRVSTTRRRDQLLYGLPGSSCGCAGAALGTGGRGARGTEALGVGHARCARGDAGGGSTAGAAGPGR